MTNASLHHVDDSMGTGPIACLDVQDDELALPIREFLESYGCIIFVNKPPKEKAEYHIIYGDIEFVKQILSRSPPRVSKPFIVISGETGETARIFSREVNGKIALVGIRPLSSRNVKEVFAFFFASSKRIKIFEEQLHDRTQKSGLRTQDLGLPPHRRVAEGGDKSPYEHSKQKGEEVLPRESVGKPQEKLMRSFEDEDRRRISDAIANIFTEEKDKQSHHTNRRGHRDEPHPVHRHPSLNHGKLLLVAVLVLFAPIFWYVTSFTISAVFVLVSAQQLRSGESAQAGKNAVAVYRWSRYAVGTLHFMRLPFQLFGVPGWFRSQERMLSLFNRLADAEVSAAVLVASGKDAATALLVPFGVTANGASPAIAAERLKQELLTLGGSLGLAQSELSILLSEKPWPFGIAAFLKKIEAGKKELASARALTQELSGFVSLYPAIAGFKEKKTYLVLFQNSMELRPTGGFIGSLATATLADGRLADFSIQDVYALDGQLKGHVDPPTPIRELLNQENWYLRDSNWDPDFTKSAPQAAWFYEKESGNRVDGVIAVSVPFLLDILAAVGPIDLSDYNDRITADNFFGKSLYYTQANFFAGSTQKKDFLGSLVTAILAKATSGKTIQPTLLRAFVHALRGGNLLLWFSDGQTQAVVKRLGWAGSIPLHQQCKGEIEGGCLSDRLMLVEANLSVNKVNYFLKRTMHQNIVFAEDGTVSESVQVAIRNVSPNDDKSGGGTYRVYSRWFIPEDAVLDSVTLDGVVVPERSTRNKGPGELPYVENATGSGSRIVAAAYDVERGSEKKITVYYHRQQALTFIKNAATYDFLLQKQPGMLNTDVTIDVAFPIFWQAQAVTGGNVSFLAKQARVTYNGDLSVSKQIKLRFVK